MRRLLLIRHAQALKNVEDRHGGGGTALTDIGRSQCDSIIHHLRRVITCDVGSSLLIGHRIPQVCETVQYFQSGLGVPTLWDERLRGIDLGVLSGLSRYEADQRWPDVAARLELWRRGQLKINELNIPGAENIDHFRERVQGALNDWLAMDIANIIAVSTRSALIMLVNLVTLAGSFSYDHYRVYEFPEASITEIAFGKQGPRLTTLASTVLKA
jgi:broad specificity phosphatase PhoE